MVIVIGSLWSFNRIGQTAPTAQDVTLGFAVHIYSSFCLLIRMHGTSTVSSVVSLSLRLLQLVKKIRRAFFRANYRFHSLVHHGHDWLRSIKHPRPPLMTMSAAYSRAFSWPLVSQSFTSCQSHLLSRVYTLYSGIVRGNLGHLSGQLALADKTTGRFFYKLGCSQFNGKELL